ECASEIYCIVNCRSNAIDGVCEKSENVKTFRSNPNIAAIFDDLALMIRRNRSSPNAFQRGWVSRFNAERDCFQSGPMQQVQQVLVQIVQTRLALELHLH